MRAATPARAIAPTMPTARKVSGNGAGSTVTVNVRLAVLPEASVAEQVTVVVPTGNVDPEAGEQTSVGVGSAASLALAS